MENDECVERFVFLGMTVDYLDSFLDEATRDSLLDIDELEDWESIVESVGLEAEISDDGVCLGIDIQNLDVNMTILQHKNSVSEKFNKVFSQFLEEKITADSIEFVIGGDF
jgi:YbbR domain-containing protein